MKKNTYLNAFFALFLLSPQAFASDSPEVLISGHTLLLVFSTALIFFMQAGFACLESGFVRSKNAINVIMKNYSDMAFGLVLYWAVGYALMYGVNSSGWIGTSEFFFDGSSGTSHIEFLYQAMFAATAATIVSGALAERTKYGSYIIGATLITGVIYPISGSWIWGGGWLAELGFIDFAGSTTVHSLGAWAALAAIQILGPRLGRFNRKGEVRDVPGHNLTLVAIGAFILWFGWFGFNGGSIQSGHDIGLVLVNTFLSASAGVISSLFLMRILGQPILMTRTINGGLAGLVAITAGAATMSAPFALATGFVAGLVVVWGESWLLKRHLDDVVGAIPVHGFSGAWGTIAAGLFFAGDLFNLDRTLVQIIGVLAIFVWGYGTSWLVFKLIDKTIGLRAPSLHEQRGLDITEHYEQAYEFQQSLTHEK